MRNNCSNMFALFLITIFALLTVGVHSKLVLVRELEVSKRSLEPVPDFLTVHVTSEDEAEPLQLTLTRTRGFKPDDVAIVLDEPVHRALDASQFKAKRREGVGYYQDKKHNAVMTVTNTAESGEHAKRTLMGTLTINGKVFELKPVAKGVQVLANLLQNRNLDAEESHMLHTLEEANLPDNVVTVDYHKRMVERKLKAKLDLKKDTERSNQMKHNVRSNRKQTYSHVLEAYATKPRHKRQADMSQTVFHVELIFLIEFSIFEYWMEETGQDALAAVEHIDFYYKHIFHGMYLTYYNIEPPSIQIRPWLLALHIATTREASSYAYYRNGYIDLQVTESNIAMNYLPSLGLTWATADSVMMWTRKEFIYGDSRGILGIAAAICGVCHPGYSISQNHEYGLFSYFTGAHELGHVLGALHDDTDFSNGNCNPEQKHLMTPYAIQLVQSTYQNSFTFSECSVDMFEQCFRGSGYQWPYNLYNDVPEKAFPRVCVYDRVCSHGVPVESDLEEALPGARYSLTEQCQLTIGDESAFYDPSCPSSEGICKQLFCKYRGECTNNNNYELRAVSGSPCDTNKVCWMGDCVPEGSFDYTPDENVDVCTDEDTASCQDTANDCEDVVNESPWDCFSEGSSGCKGSCTSAGLYIVGQEPCSSGGGNNGNSGSNDGGGSSESDTYSASSEEESGPITESTWKYSLCGYDGVNGYRALCPNHDECIPMWYFGDRVPDCPDGADEMRHYIKNVPSGVVGYVRCPGQPKRLIPEDWLCDGWTDCLGAKDEQFEKCVTAIYYCDAETNGTFNCPNNPRKCFRTDELCDGYNDCGFGAAATDEDPYLCTLLEDLNCREDQLPCPNGMFGRSCIEIWEACDGFNDCSYDEDPDFCASLPVVECESEQYQCPGKPYFCLLDSDLCDGWNDCDFFDDNSWDEQDCDGFKLHKTNETIRVRNTMQHIEKKTSSKVRKVKNKANISEAESNKISRDNLKKLALEMTRVLDSESNPSSIKRDMNRAGGPIALSVMRAVAKGLGDNE